MDVALKVGPRITTLSRLGSNSRWQLGEVTVGRVPPDFNILFEVYGELEEGEYFAIDDIDFINCSLPGKPSAQLERERKK